MENIKKGKIDIDRYRVKENEKVNLKKFPTKRDVDIDKGEVKSTFFPEVIEQLKLYQEKLYAQNTYGLIIVLQAMDAAGKDGTVNHVFANLDPGGVSVASFKQPTTEEKDHDYMWRINKAISTGQLPRDLIDRNIWMERYEQINNWEKYLHQNGFYMVKIFLHVSKEEQQERLIDRIFNQEKNWKFSMGDIHEREHWDEYRELYEELLENTSKDKSPWYIVPADNKWFTRYVVALITLDVLKKIDPKFPKLSPEEQKQLERFRDMIKKETDKPLEEIRKEMEKEEK